MILKSLLFILLSWQIHAEECRQDLKMIVTGLDSNEGQIKFDLDNADDTFKPSENGKPAFNKGRSPITEKRVEYIFKGIPCGEYGIKLYHDANMNQTLDKNFIGVPKEQYGFSNCKNCLLPPSWQKAKFIVDKNHSEITIEL
ncbi:MAG: DUF2141 domain-containing protein [Bacteriovorax sp.]|nr:DUF2141 domain-containing protein [Bacteriovorax sp.]